MTTQQMAAQTGQGTPRVMPRANSRDGKAPLRSEPGELLQVVLFFAGAVLMPAGLIVIGLSWYGTAHSPYAFDQASFLVTALFGLGMTFAGGFLYFGSWLARIAADQKESRRQLSDTLLVLADNVSYSAAAANPDGGRDAGSVLVVAGQGTTVHRADCALVAGRDDLSPAGPDAGDLTPCRICQRQ